MIKEAFNRLLEVFNLQTSKDVIRKIEAAYDAGYMDAEDEPASGDIKRYGYQSSSGRGKRTTQLSPDKMLATAWSLYQYNQAAGRYLEIVRDHVIGKGFEPVIEDESLKEIVDIFIERNDLNEQLSKFALQLRLFGEQCYPVYVRQSDGQVTIAYIDPADIEEVKCHPNNSLKPWVVILKTDMTRERRLYRIIRKDEGFVFNDVVITPNHEDKLVMAEQARLEPWEMVLLAEYGLTQYTGSCFHYGANTVSNMPRGFSDLVRPADNLDLEDETIFALGEREGMAGYFSWDVTLEGNNEAEVKTKAAEIRNRVPKKGQVNVHNDKETWALQSPDLKQPGSIATADAILDRAWGLLGMPKTWRGVGDDSNRASATVMGEPTRKTLEHKQSQVKRIFIDLLYFVRDQAEIAGYWSGDGKIEVIVPEIGERDYDTTANTLLKTATALSKARSEKVISRQTSAKVIAQIIHDGFGIEYDADDELKAVDQEQEEKVDDMIGNGLQPFGNPQSFVMPTNGASVNGN